MGQPPRNSMNTVYIFRVLESMASGIARTFGKICEVLVLDMNSGEAVAREVLGGPMTDQVKGELLSGPLRRLVLEAGRSGLAVNHHFANIQGRKLKTTVMVMRTPLGEPVAALCVSLDVTEIEIFSTVIEEFFQVDEAPPGSLPDSREEQVLTAEPDLETTIRARLGELNPRGERLTRQRRLEVINRFNDDGLFDLRGSVKILAEEMGISKFTVYSYLDEIRRKSASPGEVSRDGWVIPFFLTITGAYSGFGQMIKWTVGEAVNEINSQGGIAGRPVEVDYIDTAGDHHRCLTEMNKVIDDSLIIWGPMVAPTCQAALPLIARKEAFAMTVACGPRLVQPYRRWTVHFFNKYSEIIAAPTSAWLSLVGPVKRAVQFIWPTDSTWMDHSEAQRELLGRTGVKVLPDIECNLNTDFKEAVALALEGRPDVFIITTPPREAGLIIRELDRQGFSRKERILVYKTAESPALYDEAGSALWGAYHWNVANIDSRKRRWRRFLDKFQAVFKNRPPMFGIPMFYDMVYLTKEAMEKTGVTGRPENLESERRNISDYCRSVKNFKGVMYDFSIVGGMAETPSFLYQFQPGGLKLIGRYPPQRSRASEPSADDREEVDR